MPMPPKQDKYRILAEINMIPLIDVALVLLIIFMVMTPFLVRSQIKINLPVLKKVDNNQDRDRVVNVMVDRKGAVSVEGQMVAPEGIMAALQRVLRDPDQPVVIEADKDVAFQNVVVVMDAAKRVGATRLAVRVKKSEGR